MFIGSMITELMFGLGGRFFISDFVTRKRPRYGSNVPCTVGLEDAETLIWTAA